MCNPKLSSCVVPSYPSAARALAVLGIGAGVLAGAAPTEAQDHPAPTRFRVDAIRHVSGGDAEVDLTWLHPTGASATGFTVHYRLGDTGIDCANPPPPTKPTTDWQTAGNLDRRITIGRLDRETFACFWIRADFAEDEASGWTLVADAPIDLRNETAIGDIPAPPPPGVTAGDARVTVTFTGGSACGPARTNWFYTRRLAGEPFGDNPEDTVEVTSLRGQPGGAYPVVQNIENGKSYVFKIRLKCGESVPWSAISPWSAESGVVTPRSTINEITEPQGLSVVPVRVEGRDTAALRLTWGHPSSGAPERYRLQYQRSLTTEDVNAAWTSVTLPGSSLSYNITGLRFDTEYQIRLRGEVEDARPDRTKPEWPCDFGECGPWAEISGNTGNPNEPPVAVEDLEPIILEVGNRTDVDVAHYFSDPDGDDLAFTAFSQNGDVATVARSGAPSVFTITALSAGTATVSVSATDPAGLSARAGIEVTVHDAVVPGLPSWLDPMEVSGGGITLSWEAPANAAEATVRGYEVALWSLTAAEPASSANVRRRADQLTHTYQPGAIPPGCQYTARVRAIGENGRGNYAYMPAAQLSGPVCGNLLPAPPTDVEAEIGEFDELSRMRGVSVAWSQDGTIEPQFHQVRFSAAGGGTVQIYRTADQPFVGSRAAGRWLVDVQAGVTVDGASGHSAWSEAVEVEIAEPAPFVVRLRSVTVLPQSRHGCRPYNGPVEGMAEAYLAPPQSLPYTVEATAGSTAGVDVLFSSARDRSLHFTFLPGEVTHPLTTWVDCGIEEGERADVGITGVTAPPRYAGRVVADPTRYEIEVGNVTPVPAIPTAAALLLGAVLAGLGAIQRRRRATSDSLSSRHPDRTDDAGRNGGPEEHHPSCENPDLSQHVPVPPRPRPR